VIGRQARSPANTAIGPASLGKKIATKR
jgi:hypothetical protein